MVLTKEFNIELIPTLKIEDFQEILSYLFLLLGQRLAQRLLM